MDKVEIGDYVIVTDQDNQFYGKGALVVSHSYQTAAVASLRFVAVKVFSREWGYPNHGEWKEVFLVLEISDLRSDTDQVFEMSRLEMKFGKFWQARLLTKPLDPEAECSFCDNPTKVRIELNIWGTINQFDVCHTCAKQYDGIRCDGVPDKKVKTV